VSRFRRNDVPGGTYFFTVVTQDRRPLFTEEKNREWLHQALAKVLQKRPFEIVAMVLLPEHLHCVWMLPRDDADYSLRWAQIKEGFTRLFLADDGEEGERSASREAHRERAVWQKRFWEHTCRDEDDLERCIDYIHWNPVKHGLVERVLDYPWSTFHRYVEAGLLPADWGSIDPCPDLATPEWEE
jgi:putative transposase